MLFFFLINCPSVFVRVGVYFDYYGNIKHVHYLPVFVKKSLLTDYRKILHPDSQVSSLTQNTSISRIVTIGSRISTVHVRSLNLMPAI